MNTLHDLQEEIMRRVLAEEQRREELARRTEARKYAEESVYELTHHLTREEIAAIAQSVEEEFKRNTDQQLYAQTGDQCRDKKKKDSITATPATQEVTINKISSTLPKPAVSITKDKRTLDILKPEVSLTQDSWTLNLSIAIHGLISAIFVFLVFKQSIVFGIPAILWISILLKCINDKIIQQNIDSVRIAKKCTLRVYLPIVFSKRKRKLVRIRTEVKWNKRGWQRYHYHDGGPFNSFLFFVNKSFM